MEIDTFCPSCKARNTFEVTSATQLCACGRNLLEYATDDFKASETLNQCPVCGCAHVYRQKDFNRKLGVMILMVGVVLAYFTYGISLLVVTAIDLWLVKKVDEIGNCYQCGAVFRRAKGLNTLEPFNLSLYDYYRNLKPKA